jgi:hypothetical protein
VRIESLAPSVTLGGDPRGRRRHADEVPVGYGEISHQRDISPAATRTLHSSTSCSRVTLFWPLHGLFFNRNNHLGNNWSPDWFTTQVVFVRVKLDTCVCAYVVD